MDASLSHQFLLSELRGRFWRLSGEQQGSSQLLRSISSFDRGWHLLRFGELQGNLLVELVKHCALVRISIAVIKHNDQKQLGEGRTVSLLILPGNSSSLREVRAGTWSQGLKQRPRRNTV